MYLLFYPHVPQHPAYLQDPYQYIADSSPTLLLPVQLSNKNAFHSCQDGSLQETSHCIPLGALFVHYSPWAWRAKVNSGSWWSMDNIQFQASTAPYSEADSFTNLCSMPWEVWKKKPILAFRKFNKILCVELFYSVVWRAVDLELKSMWHHVFRKKKQIHVSKIILSRFKCELAESSFSARYTFEEAVCTQWFIHYFGGVGGCVCCFLFSLPVCLHFNNCLLLNRQY